MAGKGEGEGGEGRERDGFLAHNQRQRRAIRAYIREVTGLDLEQVPQEVQDRLALKWVRRYASQFRREEE